MNKELRKTIQKAIEMEQKTAKIMDNIKSALVEDIRAARLDGVKTLSDGKDGPMCVSVNISAVMRTNGFNLSAETYCQSAQVEAVKSAISNCKTMGALIEKIQKMYDEKKIVRSQGHTVTLNDATLSVLEEFLSEND